MKHRKVLLQGTRHRCHLNSGSTALPCAPLSVVARSLRSHTFSFVQAGLGRLPLKHISETVADLARMAHCSALGRPLTTPLEQRYAACCWPRVASSPGHANSFAKPQYAPTAHAAALAALPSSDGAISSPMPTPATQVGGHPDAIRRRQAAEQR